MSSVYDWSLTASDNDDADDLINWLEGQAPSTINNSARVMMRRIAELLRDLSGVLTSGGTANARTVSASSSFSTLANGRIVAFKSSAAHTGATTLNVNSIGAKSLRKVTTLGDVACVGGELQNGGVYVVMYSEAANSAAGGWILINPTLDAFFVNRLGTTTDNTVPRFDGTSGLIQTSGVTISDSNNVSGVVALEATGPITRSSTNSGVTGLELTTSASGLSPSIDFEESSTQTYRIRTNGGSLEFLNAGNGTRLSLTQAGTMSVNTAYTVGAFSSSGASDGKQIIAGTYDSSRNTTSGIAHSRFFNPNNQVGSITTSGSATAYNTSSDERLKEKTGNLSGEDALAIILADPVWTFNWKGTGESAVGWGAQTSYTVSPDLATPGNGNPGNDNFVPWGIDQAKRTPYLWAAVAYLAEAVAELKAQNGGQ
ncbi:MAG: hypothetical protein K5872_06615 [Rhizobiaceae bacterium]|nr:hypothetical protein [Rhizobiaceae bacterium]MCV0405885.1 hypothetical protein [Rhizobiaceae bacterium]